MNRNLEEEYQRFVRVSEKVLGFGVPSFLKPKVIELISSLPSLKEALHIISRMEWYYAQAKKYKWKKEKVFSKNWEFLLEKNYIKHFLSTEATNKLREKTFNNCLIDDQTFNVIMELAIQDYTRKKKQALLEKKNKDRISRKRNVRVE